jgi:hypothetical protein
MVNLGKTNKPDWSAIKDRLTNKRISDEKIYLTINNSNWPPNLLTYDFVERFLASSIIHLIDTIPLNSDSDFKI